MRAALFFAITVMLSSCTTQPSPTYLDAETDLVNKNVPFASPIADLMLPRTYPADMLKAGKEGDTAVVCLVDPAGKPTSCVVESISMDPSFNNAALRYARSLRYPPLPDIPGWVPKTRYNASAIWFGPRSSDGSRFEMRAFEQPMRYPLLMATERKSGTVALDCAISTQGRAHDCVDVGSKGDVAFKRKYQYHLTHSIYWPIAPDGVHIVEPRHTFKYGFKISQ